MKKEKQRYDGYLVRNLDPVILLSPYIMPRRNDSQVQVDLKLDLTKVEAFVKEYRKTIPSLTLYHIVFASIVRACAVTPEINRFIAGNRIYQRRHAKISMMVKKDLKTDGKENSIFPVFEYTDTLAEIVEKTNVKIEEALAEMESESNGFEKLIGILEHVPTPILKAFIGLVLLLDKHGRLPRFLTELQPFHSSFFVTNVGSIGLPVIYHHLYQFGTCSGFIAIGSKETAAKVKRNGTIQAYRALPVKFVLDSRICDGFTYSTAFRTIKKCFANPEILLTPYDPAAEAAESNIQKFEA